MYYLHNGRVYGALRDGDAVVYAPLRVQDGADGVTVEPAGASLPALPGGATPMTWAELVARAPRETKPAPKPTTKRR